MRISSRSAARNSRRGSTPDSSTIGSDLELTYFNKKSTDLIVNVPTAPSSGFGGSIANIGEVANTGLEFPLRGKPVRGRVVLVGCGLSGSTLHNEILELGTVGTFINNFRAFTEGRQIAAFWANKVRSVDMVARQGDRLRHRGVHR